jgi:class 3 adenylate cyclase
MRCDGCGHDNQPGAKFCSECGAALQRACTACAATLSPTAKFCDQCGQRVDGVPATADAPAAPAGGAVRKQVTAVFADLVGSTGFGERLDPEAVRAALAPYFELLQSTIDDHDGTVVKFTGDGMLALFGVPDIAEDDALRAVASGLELQRRFRAFADTVLDCHGVELGLRVGINSGELVIADGDADMVGDVLNTAARLESACDPGSVLVGEDTWRLTRSVVEYEVLGEVHVKGKAEPLATFRVLDDERTIADDIPFVGRGVELEQLLSAFGDARDSPMAQLVTVIGAPGVGKTRLAAELRGAVDARSFDLRFERRGSTTFTPIAQLLRDVTDGTIDGVTRLFTGHPDAGRVVPILGSFVGHGDVRSTEESFWAVRRLLEHLAASEPLIVVVDDIQWAEPLFWDLLDHLVEWATAPVLIIALARPELRDLRPELTQPGRRVTSRRPASWRPDCWTPTTCPTSSWNGSPHPPRATHCSCANSSRCSSTTAPWPATVTAGPSPSTPTRSRSHPPSCRCSPPASNDSPTTNAKSSNSHR